MRSKAELADQSRHDAKTIIELRKRIVALVDAGDAMAKELESLLCAGEDKVATSDWRRAAHPEEPQP